MKKKHALILSILFSFTLVKAQDATKYNRVLPSITAWVTEMQNWPDSVYKLEKALINVDDSVDQKYLNENNSSPFRHDDKYEQTPPKIIINTAIELNDITFQKGVKLHNFTFKKRFIVGDDALKGESFTIKNCIFDQNSKIISKLSKHLSLDSSLFLGETNIENKESKDIFIIGCKFLASKASPFSLYSSFEKGDLAVANCIFGPEKEFHNRQILASNDDFNNRIDIWDSYFKNVEFYNNDFNVGVFFFGNSIEGGFFFDNNRLKYYIYLYGTNFPTSAFILPFHQIENKFWGSMPLEGKPDSVMIVNQNDPLAAEDEFIYELIFQQLGTLLNMYRDTKSFKDYPKAYINFKDLESRRLKYIYQKEPSFYSYFDWKINVFMKYFSDYGTRPAKSVIVFLKILLYFSIFYFFFPSSWNTMNRDILMRKIKEMSTYLRKEKGLKEMYEEKTLPRFQKYEEFKSHLLSSQKEVPAFFQWISWPIYKFSTSYFRTNALAINKLDVLNGKWAELPRKKKYTTSLVVGIYFFFYLVYALFIRALNAITLSLNTFSTLGFGEIPTKGLARYVAIIQGFIGWFLLSVFLVSLISQVLN